MEKLTDFKQLEENLFFNCPFSHWYVLQSIIDAYDSAEDFFTNFDFENIDINPDPKKWSVDDWVCIGSVCDDILRNKKYTSFL